MPSTIRYHANTRKVCFSTNLTNALTTNKAEINAATKPTAIFNMLSWVNTSALRIRSNVAAPNMVGIAKKKENSVAALRDNPENIPPTMVAPDRDVPGIIATHCAQPTRKACL